MSGAGHWEGDCPQEAALDKVESSYAELRALIQDYMPKRDAETHEDVCRRNGGRKRAAKEASMLQEKLHPARPRRAPALMEHWKLES